MEEIIYLVIRFLIIFFIPPLLIGIINRIKAIWAGKFGQSIFQPFYDIYKLIGKETIRSNYSSFITTISLIMQFFSILFASLIIPFGKIPSLISFNGDFFFFVALITISNICQIFIAMESGGSFQGMGSSREINFSIFIEPALLLLFGSMIFYTRNYSMNKILLHFSFTSLERVMVGILLGISFFVIMLIEGKRIPIDDQTTHLELTMIHEAMLLDLSGKDLAISISSSYLKIFVFASLVSNIFIPSYISVVFSLLIFVFFIILSSVLIGLIESVFPRVRMSHVPDFMLLVLSISILIVSIIFTMNN